MKAIILAAGKGTRLYPFTKTIPKVMIPFNGKPLLKLHIEHLKKNGIKDIYINLHYKPDYIKNYFRNGNILGVNITYSLEKELLGTAGALSNFRKHLTDRFVLLFGDLFTTLNFTKMEKFHVEKKASVTVAVHTTDHPKDSDLVSIGKNFRLKRIYSKPHQILPDTRLSMAAIYIFEPKCLDLLPHDVPLDLTQDFLPILMERNKRIFCYNTGEFIKDIGTPKRYKAVLELLKK